MPFRSPVRAAVGILWAGHVITLVAFTGARASLVSNLIQLAGVALAGAACWLMGDHARYFPRRVARLLALSCAFWAIGQAGLLYYEVFRGGQLPALSPTDLAFFSFYIPLAMAVFLYPETERRRDWIRTLDFSQVAVFLCSVYLYFFVFIAGIADNRRVFVGIGFLSAWDLLNLSLAGLFFYRAASSRSPRTRALFRRIGLVFVAYAAGDGLYSYSRTVLASQNGTWWDLCYSIPFGLAALAASNWREHEVSPQDRSASEPISWWAGLFPLAAPFLVFAMAAHMLARFPLVALVVVGASFACLAMRLALTQRRQEESTRRLRAMNEANLALTRSLDVDTVLDTLLEVLSRLAPFDTANVMLVEGGDLVVRAGRGYERFTRETQIGQRFKMAGTPFLDRVRRGSSLIVPDVRKEPGWVTVPSTTYIRSWLAVPLRAGGEVIGVYSLDSKQLNFFTEDHAQLAESLAAQAAVAIQNARLYEERLKADRELSATQEKFSKAFYSHPNPMVISTLDGTRLLDVNDSYLRFFGYTREETLDGKSQAFQFYAQPAMREKLVEKIIAEGKLIEEEVQLRTKTGEVRVGLASAELIDIGGVRCILGVIRDITERVRAQEALQVSEKRFSTAFHSSPIPMMINTLPELRAAEINDSFLRLLGFTREEAIGHTGEELGTLVDLNRRNELQNMLASGGRVENASFSMRARGGQIREVLLSVELIDFGGQPHALVAALDVTERRRMEQALQASEERFLKAFRSSPDAMAISTPDEGLYIDVNEAFLALTGYSYAEVAGRSVAQLHIWEDPEQRVRFAEMLGQHGRVRNIDFHLRTKPGVVRSCLLSAEMIELDGRKHILSVVRDLTEYKQLEEQFRQSQKMEAIGRLAGGVAHDFNNLLMVIIGRCDVALTTMDEKMPAAANVEEAQRAAWKAASLTRQLLAFSRKQVLQPQVLNLNTVAANLQKLLVRMIGEDVTLVFRPAANLGQVKADPGGIEQILMNLCVNARDAMPGGGRLTIETANIEFDDSYVMRHGVVSPGRYAMLAVSDTGVGMDGVTQARIFEPFFTTKESGKGTGLGLSTVYGIVKQSGGFIWVYSEMGKGATFKVYLPRVDDPVEPAAESVAPLAVSRGAGTILLVEDEPQVRELATEFLRGAGYSVLAASNGRDALAIAAGHTAPLHLVLTDVVMPGMGGREMVEQLVTQRPALKVIYLSGYTDEAVSGHGELPHGSAFLQKPFRMTDLAARIRAVLDA